MHYIHRDLPPIALMPTWCPLTGPGAAAARMPARKGAPTCVTERRACIALCVQISGSYTVHSEDVQPLYDIADQLLDVFDTAHIRYSRMEPGCAGFPVFAALQSLAQRAVASGSLPENETVPPMQQGLDVLKVRACTLCLCMRHGRFDPTVRYQHRCLGLIIRSTMTCVPWRPVRVGREGCVI